MIIYLRSHPKRRAHGRVASSLRALQMGTHAEIDQLDRAILGDEYVVALDVAMHHVMLVQVLEREQRLPQDVSDHGLVEFEAHLDERLGQIGHRAVRAQLEHEPELVLFVVFLHEDAKEFGQIRMIGQVAQDEVLFFDLFDHLVYRLHDLDRCILARLQVTRLEHLAVRALADALQQFPLILRRL